MHVDLSLCLVTLTYLDFPRFVPFSSYSNSRYSRPRSIQTRTHSAKHTQNLHVNKLTCFGAGGGVGTQQ